MEVNSSVTQSKYSDDEYSGVVKWFNRTAGWGFVTVIGDGQTTGDDIFVHWNSLSVDKEQYRYLVNGEYVSFKISFNKDAKHPYQAQGVRGVNGGKLMCDTHTEQFRSRSENARSTGGRTEHRSVAPRGLGPRSRSRSRSQNTRSTGGRTDHRSVAPRKTFVDDNGETWVMVVPRSR